MIKKSVGRPKGTNGIKHYPFKQLDTDNIQNLVSFFVSSPHYKNSEWDIYEQNNQFYLENYFTTFFQEGIPDNPVKFAMIVQKKFTGTFTIKTFNTIGIESRHHPKIEEWLYSQFQPSFMVYYEQWPKMPSYEKKRKNCTSCGRKEDYTGQYLRTYCDNCNSLKENIRGKIKSIEKSKIPIENIEYLIEHLRQEIKIYESIKSGKESPIPELTANFVKEQSYVTLNWRKYQAKHEKQFKSIH